MNVAIILNDILEKLKVLSTIRNVLCQLHVPRNHDEAHQYEINLSQETKGSFTLTESDSETDTDFIKFYCQWVSISMNTSIQFHASHLLPCLGI